MKLKKFIKSRIPMFGMLAMFPICCMANTGVEVEQLGVNNTLVRVTGDARYLLLPVEDSKEDATVNVIVDGKLESSMKVRLAKSKVDLMVPFDLTPYKGKNVVLNIITAQDRSSVRDTQNDACWEEITLSDTYDTTNREKYRPLYHHTPLYGWMNDPNGMYYKDGVWHLAYQWNPYGSKWQNMTWGQSTSRDLIHWDKSSEAVLVPDGLGTIFSGSAIIDKDNTAGFGEDAVIAFYTSADVSQMQSMAVASEDGKSYEPYVANPIITLNTEARDPNVFWDADNNRWVLTLAHALDHEMLIFTSPDLKKWTLSSSFGKGLGSQDGVWECPDLFELPVAGTDKKKWVLICNINPGGPFGGSATQYFVGDFDGTTFTADTDAEGNVATKWMDYGKDHYATVSFYDAPDNRRTVIGWMSNWQYAADVPTLQFRSANTLPRDVELFEAPDGQIYMASIPSPELDALRGKRVKSVRNKSLGVKEAVYMLPVDNDGVCEIVAQLDAQKGADAVIELSNTKGEKVVLTYDSDAHTLSFDRRESGITDFCHDFPSVTVSPTFENDGKLNLRIFIDRSSIEVFGNDGRFVMTNLVFPNEPYNKIGFSSVKGKTMLQELNIYSIAGV